MSEPAFLSRTRASYDALAGDYATRFAAELVSKPWDRAVLAGFAETVLAAGGGPVVDVGCGPGRVTAHLHRLGVDASGVDLSTAMVAQARAAHPELAFCAGSMTALDRPDGALAGIVAWYSIIHIPTPRLPEVFAEFRRVLRPGGHLAMVFQVGDEPLHVDEAWGHRVDLDFERRRPDEVAELLHAAGLAVRMRLVREPEDYQGGTERVPQAYLLARRD